MKKIMALTLFLASFAGYSQIELVETESSEIISKVSYLYLEKKGENEYSFYYKNMNSVGHEYANFTFKDLDNDLEKLYQIIVKGFEEKPRDPLKIKANGAVVWLNYKTDDISGETLLTVEQFEDEDPEVSSVSRPVNKEDIDKLFRK